MILSAERVQDIYENGAELTTEELGAYLEATVVSNFDPFFVIDPRKWQGYAEQMHEVIIQNSAESFDWKLEYRGENKWYLHPWGGV